MYRTLSIDGLCLVASDGFKGVVKFPSASPSGALRALFSSSNDIVDNLPHTSSSLLHIDKVMSKSARKRLVP